MNHPLTLTLLAAALSAGCVTYPSAGPQVSPVQMGYLEARSPSELTVIGRAQLAGDVDPEMNPAMNRVITRFAWTLVDPGHITVLITAADEVVDTAKLLTARGVINLTSRSGPGFILPIEDARWLATQTDVRVRATARGKSLVGVWAEGPGSPTITELQVVLAQAELTETNERRRVAFAAQAARDYQDAMRREALIKSEADRRAMEKAVALQERENAAAARAAARAQAEEEARARAKAKADAKAKARSDAKSTPISTPARLIPRTVESASPARPLPIEAPKLFGDLGARTVTTYPSGDGKTLPKPSSVTTVPAPPPPPVKAPTPLPAPPAPTAPPVEPTPSTGAPSAGSPITADTISKGGV